MSTVDKRVSPDRTVRNARQSQASVRRLIRRVGVVRAQWADTSGAMLATDKAWRRGVHEGLRLAQAEIRRGV